MKPFLILVILCLSLGVSKADGTLPFKVTFRESLLNKGTFVNQFRNNGNELMVLHIEITRANGSEKKTFTLAVPANSYKEIGKLQGWVGFSGDTIRIQSAGYDELDVSIP